ncbi:uncharacterized protein LOC116337635 [Contarinia nasturtii]|uniref:uncharacterized protein LOC116337635 n=1 Tax=Contarinia nasturtii TaxID=265458 RepID=UPI0012D45913|nr:uncharacterized protein LOC116337635 [Contarinia nasturtii]
MSRFIRIFVTICTIWLAAGQNCTIEKPYSEECIRECVNALHDKKCCSVCDIQLKNIDVNRGNLMQIETRLRSRIYLLELCLACENEEWHREEDNGCQNFTQLFHDSGLEWCFEALYPNEQIKANELTQLQKLSRITRRIPYPSAKRNVTITTDSTPEDYTPALALCRRNCGKNH